MKTSEYNSFNEEIDITPDFILNMYSEIKDIEDCEEKQILINKLKVLIDHIGESLIISR